MSIHYLYIDDDPESDKKVTGLCDDELSISSIQHEDSWELQLDSLKEHENEYDGLILDLKLDDLPNNNGIRAKFRGTALAQEIRTRQKEGILKSFPIILFSANDKTQRALEKSGSDLFDILIDKSKLNNIAFPIYTRQLKDISKAYNLLNDFNVQVEQLFATNISFLDTRFIREFNEIRKSPVHIQSRFLLTEFLQRQGLLINEEILAARLGIDKSKSTGWKTLLDKIAETKYNGIYSCGWPRWWMHLIEQWWSNIIKCDSFLRSTSASERVERIKSMTGIKDLFAAEKIDKAESDEYWTICKGLKRPLDPVDGLVILSQDNLYSWQEPEYVSIEAALWRKNIDDWIGVADIEEERYKELKIIYSQRKK